MSRVGKRPADALCRVLGRQDVAIVSHYHPDPDALASAAALASLLRTVAGKRPVLITSGEVGRSENRALVNLLALDLVPIEEVLPGFDGDIVLLDTQPGRANSPLPPARRPTAVVDHHPDWGDNADIAFLDLRPDYGATASIVTEYFQELELQIEPALAAALFYGISSETQRLAREASAADIVASQYLFPYVDKRLLGAIQTPELPAAHFVMMAEAVRSTVVLDDVALTFVEALPYSDAAGEVADLIVRLETVHWAACIGRRGDSLVASVRTDQADVEAGRLLASIFPPGNAGGHSMTAGGKAPLDGRDWESAARDYAARLVRKLDRPASQLSSLSPRPSPLASRLLASLPAALASRPVD